MIQMSHTTKSIPPQSFNLLIVYTDASDDFSFLTWPSQCTCMSAVWKYFSITDEGKANISWWTKKASLLRDLDLEEQEI